MLVSFQDTSDLAALRKLSTTGRLTGDIRAPKIVIAEGAQFRGNSDMTARKESRPEPAKESKPPVT